MTSPTRAPLYDLFKLIVAIILLLIFIFLVWIQPTGASQPVPSTSTSTPLPSSTSTVASPTQTSIPPTMTPEPTDTPSPTSAPTLETTNSPEATESPVPETLPTPIIEIPSEPEVCAAVSRSQLQTGMKAIIQRRLNFRSSPGIMNNWMLTNLPGTQVEVIGGPACTRYQNGGAYLWWQIKLPNGLTGWSAEASAFGTFYFMEPVK